MLEPSLGLSILIKGGCHLEQLSDRKL